LYWVALITYGLFTIKAGSISCTIAIGNDFFFTALEATEMITLEIIVLC
jgi:hypothetical protein